METENLPMTKVVVYQYLNRVLQAFRSTMHTIHPEASHSPTNNKFFIAFSLLALSCGFFNATLLLNNMFNHTMFIDILKIK